MAGGYSSRRESDIPGCWSKKRNNIAIIATNCKSQQVKNQEYEE
jgi:hypothetical protein